MQPINQVLLTSARGKVSKTPDLNTLADDHKNAQIRKLVTLYESAKLTAEEIITLYHASLNDVNDAKIFAAFLHQIDNNYIREIFAQSQYGDKQTFNQLRNILLNKEIHYRTALYAILKDDLENRTKSNHIIYLLGLTEVKQQTKVWGGDATGFVRLNQLKNDPEYGPALQIEFPDYFSQVQVKPQLASVDTARAWQTSHKPEIPKVETIRKRSKAEIPEIEKAIVDKLLNIMEKESQFGIKPELFKDLYKELHKYNLGDRTVYPNILANLKQLLQQKTQVKQDSLTKKTLKTLGDLSGTFQKNEHSHVVSYVIYEALKQQDNQKILSYLSQYESNRKVHPELVNNIPKKLLDKHTQQVQKPEAQVHKNKE